MEDHASNRGPMARQLKLFRGPAIGIVNKKRSVKQDLRIGLIFLGIHLGIHSLGLRFSLVGAPDINSFSASDSFPSSSFTLWTE